MKYQIYHNENGPDIGCGESKGIIEQDGLFFKDLEGTGELLPYEDWRLPAEVRAEDLAGRLTIEEIAGLMLYSPHQRVPAPAGGPFSEGRENGGRRALSSPEGLAKREKARYDKEKDVETIKVNA